MLPEKLQFNASRILEIADSSQGSDIYMSVKLILLDTLTNKNGVLYSEDFIHDIAENKQEYLAIPLVAEINKLESGKTKNLGHKYDKKTGSFGTQMIGSFVDFSTQKNGDVLELVGEARIPKRFEKVCAAIQDLYDSEQLMFSYEIMVADFKMESGVKHVDKSDNNKLFAMAVVSTPAVESAKALALVAAIESDLNIDQGGEEVVPKIRDINITVEDMFAETKTYFENAELDMSQIRAKIYQQLKNIFKDSWYNYDIAFLFMSYIIVKDYNQGDYYKIAFEVGDSEVTLGDPVKVTISFVETANKEVQTAMEEKIKELELKLVESATKISTLETEVAEANKTVEAKDVEIAALNSTVTTLSETVVTKDTEIASLSEAKASYDVLMAEKAEVEKAEKVTALKDKYSKLFSAEVLAEAEIATAIANLDESVLKDKVTELALASALKTKVDPKPAEKKTLIASRMTDEIRIEGSGSSLIMRK